MIKINLLAERKAKRQTEPGEQSVAIGFGIVAVAGFAVFLLVHRPLNADIEQQQSVNAGLQGQNAQIQQATSDFESRKSAAEGLEARKLSKDALGGAKATPAWWMWELSKILTRGKAFTITEEKQLELDRSPNLRWQESWDPKHVWITTIEEKDGGFALRGAAQSDGDVTQLSQRLSASAFFDEVRYAGSNQNSDSRSGISFYSFTITGRVRY